MCVFLNESTVHTNNGLDQLSILCASLFTIMGVGHRDTPLNLNFNAMAGNQ